MLLSVPHFQQEQAASCVPACVRMVLADYGKVLDEFPLSKVLQTSVSGTGLWGVELLENLAPEFVATTHSLTLEQITEFLEKGTPVIMFVNTTALSYWQQRTIHAIVVIGLDEGHVYVNDPKFADAPQPIPRAEFLDAWEELDYFAAIIQPRGTKE